MRLLALTLLMPLLTACGATGAPPTATPSPIPPTATPIPPTPTRAIPTATVTPPPTPTPLPPTATPTPTLLLRISAQLDPPTPHAGEEFVLSLAISNEGQRAAHGVFIATSGPWDRWTVLDIQPSGMIERDAAGWHVVSPIEIAPSETQTLEVHITADEPAQEQLTFALREAEPGELPH